MHPPAAGAVARVSQAATRSTTRSTSTMSPHFELLLQHGGDPNEPARNSPLTDWGSPLLWAIRRRRSRRYIAALLDAGADLGSDAGRRSAYTLPCGSGFADVAELLRASGAHEPISEEEAFIAACACGDEAEARRIRSRRHDLPEALPASQFGCCPNSPPKATTWG